MGKRIQRIADLFSGRIHKTLNNLQTFRNEVYNFMGTETQRINAINERLGQIGTTLRQQFTALQQEVEVLKGQAQGPAIAEHELADVDTALDNLDETIGHFESIGQDGVLMGGRPGGESQPVAGGGGVKQSTPDQNTAAGSTGNSVLDQGQSGGQQQGSVLDDTGTGGGGTTQS